MRILLICHDSPLDRSYGGGLRTNDVWRALGVAGSVSTLVLDPSDRTTLVPPTGPEELARIRIRKPSLPWVTPETRRIRTLVTEVTRTKAFDVVVIRHLRVSMLLEHCFTAPVIADCDDLDMTPASLGKGLVRRLSDVAKHAARRWVSRRAIRRVAHVWYSNPRDMGNFPALSGSVVPNVVEPPTILRPPDDPVTPARLLMVGKFGYEPNAEGADFFIREVLPEVRSMAPGTTLRLVGQCPPEHAARWRAAPGVEVAGFVDDLGIEYARAAVVVAPVFSGGGTQIKVLEALGYGCGTVVSAFAARGFAPHVRSDRHALVAGDAADWVACCLRLIKEPDLARRLGQAGREVILQRYSFENLAAEVLSTVTRVAQPTVATTATP